MVNYQEPVPELFFANQDVIIYSQTMGGWVAARIVSANADDSVTVRYDTGHTKLVPLEYQATHLRPASGGSPPPEPTLARIVTSEELGYGSALPSLFNLPDIQPLGQQPRNDSFAQSPPPPVAAPQTHSNYAVGQQVYIYSASTKAWVLAKISAIDAQRTVTAQYAGNQKLVPVENHQTHLRAAVPGQAPPSGPPSAQSRSAPPASVCIPQPVAKKPIQPMPYGKSFAVSNNQGYDFFAKQPACQQASYGSNSGGNSGNNYGSQNDSTQDYYNGVTPPPQQSGTFQFDLSQLCNDAAPAGKVNAEFAQW